MSTIDIIGIALVMNDLFIFIPLLVYSLYQFHNIQNSDVMKERKHKLVYYMNVLSIISIIIFQPFNVFSHLLSSNILKSKTVEWIMHIFQTLFVSSIYSLFLCKIWLLYFKKQYHTSLASQTWGKVINSRFNSWFVVNKNKWGNDRYILRLISIPLIICVIIELLSFYSNFYIHSILIISILLSIPTFILFWKLKDFNDNIHKIKNEIHYQCIIMSIIVMTYVVQFTVEFVNIYYKTAHSDHLLYTLICILIGDFALFLMSISSSIYPVYLHNSIKTESTLAVQISSQSSDTNSKSTKGKVKCTVNDMLNLIATYHGFQAFMLHLVTEYSTETLFFITELIQIKYEFQRQNNNMLKLPKHTNCNINSTNNDATNEHTIDFDIHLNEKLSGKDIQTKKNSSIIELLPAHSYLFTHNGSIYCRILLPIGIPKSELIHSHKKSFKNQLYELYLKYVKMGSIHQVNISSNARNVMDKYFKDYNINKNNENDTENKSDCVIFNMMDAACIELIKLMFISYTRFYLQEKNKSIETADTSFISSKWNRTAVQAI